MPNYNGNPGNKGGGRSSYGLEEKIKTLKKELIEAVLEDCEKNPPRKLYWAEQFKNRLMPQEVTGANGDSIKIEVINYANSVPVQTEALPIAIATSDGLGEEESNNSLES